MSSRLQITLELTGDEAWALSQFLKRAGFDHYRSLAMDEDEGHKMRDAGETVRRVLSEVSCLPR